MKTRGSEGHSLARRGKEGTAARRSTRGFRQTSAIHCTSGRQDRRPHRTERSLRVKVQGGADGREPHRRRRRRSPLGRVRRVEWVAWFGISNRRLPDPNRPLLGSLPPRLGRLLVLRSSDSRLYAVRHSPVRNRRASFAPSDLSIKPAGGFVEPFDIPLSSTRLIASHPPLRLRKLAQGPGSQARSALQKTGDSAHSRTEAHTRAGEGEVHRSDDIGLQPLTSPPSRGPRLEHFSFEPRTTPAFPWRFAKIHPEASTLWTFGKDKNGGLGRREDKNKPIGSTGVEVGQVVCEAWTSNHPSIASSSDTVFDVSHLRTPPATSLQPPSCLSSDRLNPRRRRRRRMPREPSLPASLSHHLSRSPALPYARPSTVGPPSTSGSPSMPSVGMMRQPSGMGTGMGAPGSGPASSPGTERASGSGQAYEALLAQTQSGATAGPSSSSSSPNLSGLGFAQHPPPQTATHPLGSPAPIASTSAATAGPSAARAGHMSRDSSGSGSGVGLGLGIGTNGVGSTPPQPQHQLQGSPTTTAAAAHFTPMQGVGVGRAEAGMVVGSGSAKRPAACAECKRLKLGVSRRTPRVIPLSVLTGRGPRELTVRSRLAVRVLQAEK